jgi:hypothetical protein
MDAFEYEQLQRDGTVDDLAALRSFQGRRADAPVQQQVRPQVQPQPQGGGQVGALLAQHERHIRGLAKAHNEEVQARQALERHLQLVEQHVRLVTERLSQTIELLRTLMGAGGQAPEATPVVGERLRLPTPGENTIELTPAEQAAFMASDED